MTKNSLFALAMFGSQLCLPSGRAFGQKDTVNYSQEFDHIAWFHDTVFKKDVTFRDATFLDSATFHALTFMENVQFTDATFSKYVNFTGVHFGKGVYFDDATFLKNVYFDDATFSTFAKFTNLQQTDSTQMDFSNATLPDTMDFSENASLKCIINLTTANFAGSTRYDANSGDYKNPYQIFLYRTDISKFRLDYFHFRLLLPDSTLSPTYQTKREKISKDEKDAIYESLLNNFKLSGQDESYKRLDIEYQAFEWDQSWARWLRWVPLVWWNYGYDKEYIFFWIIGLLVIFTIVNFYFLDYLNNSVYKVEGIPAKTVHTGRKQRMWYSAIYTSNIFFRLTLETGNIKFKKMWPTIYFLFIFVMGILCLGYLANFILQK